MNPHERTPEEVDAYLRDVQRRVRASARRRRWAGVLAVLRGMGQGFLAGLVAGSAWVVVAALLLCVAVACPVLAVLWLVAMVTGWSLPAVWLLGFMEHALEVGHDLLELRADYFG